MEIKKGMVHRTLLPEPSASCVKLGSRLMQSQAEAILRRETWSPSGSITGADGVPICEAQVSEIEATSAAVEAAAAAAREAQQDATLRGHADRVLDVLEGLRGTLVDLHSACKFGHRNTSLY
jgi:hypothetical protein